MRLFLSLAFVVIVHACFGQPIIEWSPNYKLTLLDFKSSETEINSELNSFSLLPGTNTDFGFQMSSYEFMFKKNFNEKVITTFNQNIAAIMAPDSLIANQLVNFSQYNFDLTELYSRKFRKEIYENKGAFSNISFFQPILEKLQNEMTAENNRVIKLTDFGKNSDLLKKEHEQVLVGIESLSDFCKECKPPKKKKR